jgi:hypothetical protein
MPLLVGMAGMGIDFGRVYIAKARLQGAVDAAALAGSVRFSDDPDMTQGKVSAGASEYLARNYPEAQVESLAPGSQVRTLCVNGRVNVPMTFLTLFGIHSQSVRASACAGFNDLEVVLVIDNSGSMNGTPIANTRTAARQLVDLLIPPGSTAAVKIGLVPFRSKVHIPAGVDGLPDGCRNADGTFNNVKVQYTCLTPIPPVKSLTTSPTTIKNAINQMTAPSGTLYSSGTVISEGIKWGRHVLTPEPPYTEAGNPDRYRKVMILLTDGGNDDGPTYCAGTAQNPDANAYYGMGDTTCHCDPGGCLDQAVRREADLAKEQKIEIFVVRYCRGGCTDYSDGELLKYVASSRPGTNDHYFVAPDTNGIREMFKKIGQQLGYRLMQ